MSPIKNMSRTVTRDLELHGQTLHEGDQVVLMYPAANRDPAVFDDPDQLDVRRDPNPHLAFGFGPHFCMGASLARLELQVMFTELHAPASRPAPRRRADAAAVVQLHLGTGGHARGLHPVRNDGDMTSDWVTTAASAVQPGERVRLPSGDEMTATRVDRRFMGMDTMVAIIEDTTEGWFKRPLASDAKVEVQRPADRSDRRAADPDPVRRADDAGRRTPARRSWSSTFASKCGLTPHYAGLQRLHERYADAGFTVLGFPCNQFGGQEPGTHEEIAELCSTS